jgi:signal transduction histidine kinase
LKTPLAILRAGVDHLSRATDLNETQMAEVATLRQQIRRLTSLIEDLLLLAQADAGRMFLEKEAVDLKTRIQASCDDLLVLATDRGITVEEEVEESLPVMADRRLLGMILQNLFENAVKYTPEGGRIRISGKLSAGVVVMNIANTGPGIPAEDQEHVFQRFRRGSTVGGEVKGHGLGLNIARELARAHDGELLLSRSDGEWTEFELRLPAGG